ncbi:MAG: shikimate kinase [Methanocorpusculum sp.]|nr:shikimate kinase [Methanocorpusculum sp.]
MTGFGKSHGALTVVNAIASGFGSAFGINLETRAEADIRKKSGFTLEINGIESSPKFAELLIHEISPEIKGAAVKTFSDIPLSMGLKSSSAAANAILLASADALGVEISPLELLKKNTRASINAGVSITGAFDDAAACLLGGLVFTDNKNCEIVSRREMPEGISAVIHLPKYITPKSVFPSDKLREKKSEVEKIYLHALDGDVFKAMYDNGKCTCEALGISTKTADFALSCGAKAAGLSGTGPATGILVDSKNLEEFLEKFGRTDCIVTNLWEGK